MTKLVVIKPPTSATTDEASELPFAEVVELHDRSRLLAEARHAAAVVRRDTKK